MTLRQNSTTTCWQPLHPSQNYNCFDFINFSRNPWSGEGLVERRMDSITDLNAVLSLLISEVQFWDLGGGRLERLPASLKALWDQLQNLQRSSVEAERLMRQQLELQGHLTSYKKPQLDTAVEAITKLRGEWMAMKDSLPSQDPLFNTKTSRSLTNDLRQCHCEVLSLIETLKGLASFVSPSAQWSH